MDKGNAKSSNKPSPPKQGTCGSIKATEQPKRCMDKAPRDAKNTQGHQISKTTSIIKPGDGTRAGGKTINKPGF